MVDRLRLKAASIEQPTQYLSGGNQQKVALMRPFLRDDLNVILADEPTQGVDVGARLDIYHALRDKAAEGTAVLVKSSDAIELAGICDRVVVMSRGIIVDEILRDDLDERRIIAAIIGRSSAHGGAQWRMMHEIRPQFQRGRWLPIAAMSLLIVLLGAYTNGKDSAFLSTFNLNGVMVATLPLALAAMAQTSALMVKAFDVSVGALITLCVVVSSFVLGPDESWPSLFLGMLFVIVIALGVGAVNVALIRWLKLSSIIATLATYSVAPGRVPVAAADPEGQHQLRVHRQAAPQLGLHAGRVDRRRCHRGRRGRLAVSHTGWPGGSGDGARRGGSGAARSSSRCTCSSAPSSSPRSPPRSAASSSPLRSASATRPPG